MKLVNVKARFRNMRPKNVRARLKIVKLGNMRIKSAKLKKIRVRFEK